MNWGLFALLLVIWWVLMLLTVSTVNALSDAQSRATEAVAVASMTVVFLGLMVVLA